MFSILSHKSNANQNFTNIASHLSQNGYHQENKPTKKHVLMRMHGNGTLVHLVGM
jgi:hypothetical protein